MKNFVVRGSKFLDGSEPTVTKLDGITDGEVIVVAERDGVSVYISSDEGDYWKFSAYVERSTPKKCVLAMAQVILDDIKNLDDEVKGYVICMRDHYPEMHESNG